MFKKILFLCLAINSINSNHGLDTAIEESDLEYIRQVLPKIDLSHVEKIHYFDLANSIMLMRKDRINTADLARGFGKFIYHPASKENQTYYKIALSLSFLTCISSIASYFLVAKLADDHSYADFESFYNKFLFLCKKYKDKYQTFSLYLAGASALSYFIFFVERDRAGNAFRQVLYDNSIKIRSMFYANLFVKNTLTNFNNS